MGYEIKIDRQGRVIIPKILRESVGIQPDSTVTIKQVRAGGEIGLLITKGGKKP